MSWKPTAVLAALLALALLAYFGWNPAPPVLDEAGRKLLPLAPQELVRIEVARRDEPPYVVERGKDAAGEYWRLAPSGRAADPGAVQKMIHGIDQFSKTTGIDPSRPEAAPSLTGLDAPRLSVTFHASGGKHVLRFGASPPTNTEAVFFQLEGDPTVYHAGKDTVAAYDRPADGIRSRQLFRFAPHAAVSVETSFKFTVSRPGQPPRVEYEKSRFERVEQGVERGWWLASPVREKVEDLAVNRLVTDLSTLAVESFEPEGEAKARELDEPEFTVSVRLHGVPDPLEIHFGGAADAGRSRWVRVPGSGEHAKIARARYDNLPRQRGDFRARSLYQFSKDQVRTLEVEADGLGRLLIERKETRREGDPVPAVTWEVLEPKGARIRREKVEPYVRDVIGAEIKHVGAVDFAEIASDSPIVSMTVETTDGKRQRSRFKASGNYAWGTKEGAGEVFEVLPSFVRLLQLLELALLQEEVFSTLRDRIRRFEFAAAFGGHQPVRYLLDRDPKTGAWAFTDPEHQGKAADQERVKGFLMMLSYIAAEGGRFVGRDAETLRKYRLNDPAAPARLTIWTEDGPEAAVTLLISDNQNPQPALFTYFARRTDTPAVFRIVPQLVETLKVPPVEKR